VGGLIFSAIFLSLLMAKDSESRIDDWDLFLYSALMAKLDGMMRGLLLGRVS
jgi:hypothetical protein